MAAFQPDNPFLRVNLSFADLCCLNSLKGDAEIRPEHYPLLTGVEAVRERNAPVNSPQIASRYHLVFPGSGFMRIAIKVDEPTPSISAEMIEKRGGMLRVSIEGFSGGVFEVEGGGARPYFKATRVTPVQAVPASKS